ncbi:MAG: hypothetical protein H6708_04695 [Kofleriaceae bacterium]|nr:hypothetical protein [Kofleriaceae bacterium]
MIAVVVIAAVTIVIAAVASAHASQERRKGSLEQLSAWLHGLVEGNAVTGTLDGVKVRLAYESRGSGTAEESWTYVEAPLPPAYPLTLHVEAHRMFDRGKIERGEMVDIVVGDPPFDDRFRVEGAPEAVIRRLLTPSVRGHLLSYDRVEVATVGGQLRLAVRGWLEDVEAARGAIVCAVTLSRAVRVATQAVDEAVPLTSTSDPYRAVADDGARRAARAARAAEVAHVDGLRRERAARTGAFLMVGVALVIVIAIAGTCQGG